MHPKSCMLDAAANLAATSRICSSDNAIPMGVYCWYKSSRRKSNTSHTTRVFNPQGSAEMPQARQQQLGGCETKPLTRNDQKPGTTPAAAAADCTPRANGSCMQAVVCAEMHAKAVPCATRTALGMHAGVLHMHWLARLLPRAALNACCPCNTSTPKHPKYAS